MMTATGGIRPRADAIYYYVAVDALAAASHATDEPVRMGRVLTAVVFSAMCLEAHANELCADKPADFRNRFESLRATDKWQRLAQEFGNGSAFDEAGPPFSDFKDLIRLRNDRLVHFKPWNEERWFGREYHDATFLDLASDVSIAEHAVAVVHAMINELHRLTRGRTPVPAFLGGQRIVANVWSEAVVAFEATSAATRTNNEATAGEGA